MNESEQLDLEQSIHEFLCGGLGSRERRRLLLRICENPEARAIMVKMITMQQEVRLALGYDGAEEAIASSLERFGTSVLPGYRSPAGSPRTRRRRYLRGVWQAGRLVRVAAVVVITTCAYVVYVAHQGSFAGQGGSRAALIAPAELTSAELAKCARIWDEVFDPRDKTIPWMLLSNGGGQFGHLATFPSDSATDSIIVLQCLVVLSDGRTLEKTKLLLPVEDDVELVLPDAGRLYGHPVQFEIKTSSGWVYLDLRVEGKRVGTVGIGGQIRIGDKAAEIGRFKLHEQDLRVVVQAVSARSQVG